MEGRGGEAKGEAWSSREERSGAGRSGVAWRGADPWSGGWAVAAEAGAEAGPAASGISPDKQLKEL